MKIFPKVVAAAAFACAVSTSFAQSGMLAGHSDMNTIPPAFRPGELSSVLVGPLSKHRVGYVLQRSHAYDLCSVHRKSGEWKCTPIDVPYVPIVELFLATDAGERSGPRVGIRLHETPDWRPSITEASTLARRMAAAAETARMLLLAKAPHHKALDPEEGDPPPTRW